jgi:sugar phosphate permease
MEDIPLGSNLGSRPSVQAKWAVVMLFMFLFNTVFWAIRSIFGIAVIVWQTQYGWTNVIIGLMGSVFSLAYGVSQPFGGYIVDKFGTKKMTAFCCVGWSVFTLLTPVAPAILWLTGVIRALTGVFEGPFMSAMNRTVARGVPDKAKRGRYSAILQSANQIGPALATAGGGALVSLYGPVSIFGVFGMVGLLMALVWWLYMRNRTEARIVLVDEQQKAEALQREKEPEYPLKKLLRSSTIWALFLCFFSVPYASFVFLTWLPLYLKEYRHFNLVQAGLLTALPSIIGFFGYISSGYFSDFLASKGLTRDGINRKMPIWIGALFYVVCLPLAAMTSSAALAVALLIVAHFGLGFYSTNYWVLVTDIAPNQTGTITGFMGFFGMVGGTVAPILTGYLVTVTNGFTVPFMVSAAIVFLAGLASAIFIRVKPLSQLIPD